MDAFAHYEKVEVDEDELPEVDEEEVALHNTPEDLWIIVYGKVYDVTEWQDSHPGGDFILQDNGGQDCSELFRSVQHSKDAMDIRSNFLIAKLKKKSKFFQTFIFGKYFGKNFMPPSQQQRLELSDGSIYIGETNEDDSTSPLGFGLLISPTGDQFFGSFANSFAIQPPGISIQGEDVVAFGNNAGYFASSVDAYLGEINISTLQRTGYGIRWFRDGKTSLFGRFESGLAHGCGIFVERDETYFGELQNGLPHGHGCRYSSNGCFQGQFQHGYVAGFGTFTQTNGVEMSGEWANNNSNDGEKLIRLIDMYDSTIRLAQEQAVKSMRRAKSQLEENVKPAVQRALKMTSSMRTHAAKTREGQSIVVPRIDEISPPNFPSAAEQKVNKPTLQGGNTVVGTSRGQFSPDLVGETQVVESLQARRGEFVPEEVEVVISTAKGIKPDVSAEMEGVAFRKLSMEEQQQQQQQRRVLLRAESHGSDRVDDDSEHDNVVESPILHPVFDNSLEAEWIFLHGRAPNSIEMEMMAELQSAKSRRENIEFLQNDTVIRNLHQISSENVAMMTKFNDLSMAKTETKELAWQGQVASSAASGEYVFEAESEIHAQRGGMSKKVIDEVTGVRNELAQARRVNFQVEEEDDATSTAVHGAAQGVSRQGKALNEDKDDDEWESLGKAAKLAGMSHVFFAPHLDKTQQADISTSHSANLYSHSLSRSSADYNGSDLLSLRSKIGNGDDSGEEELASVKVSGRASRRFGNAPIVDNDDADDQMGVNRIVMGESRSGGSVIQIESSFNVLRVKLLDEHSSAVGNKEYDNNTQVMHTSRSSVAPDTPSILLHRAHVELESADDGSDDEENVASGTRQFTAMQSRSVEPQVQDRLFLLRNHPAAAEGMFSVEANTSSNLFVVGGADDDFAQRRSATNSSIDLQRPGVPATSANAPPIRRLRLDEDDEVFMRGLLVGDFALLRSNTAQLNNDDNGLLLRRRKMDGVDLLQPNSSSAAQYASMDKLILHRNRTSPGKADVDNLTLHENADERMESASESVVYNFPANDSLPHQYGLNVGKLSRTSEDAANETLRFSKHPTSNNIVKLHADNFRTQAAEEHLLLSRPRAFGDSKDNNAQLEKQQGVNFDQLSRTSEDIVRLDDPHHHQQNVPQSVENYTLLNKQSAPDGNASDWALLEKQRDTNFRQLSLTSEDVADDVLKFSTLPMNAQNDALQGSIVQLHSNNQQQGVSQFAEHYLMLNRPSAPDNHKSNNVARAQPEQQRQHVENEEFSLLRRNDAVEVSNNQANASTLFAEEEDAMDRASQLLARRRQARQDEKSTTVQLHQIPTNELKFSSLQRDLYKGDQDTFMLRRPVQQVNPTTKASDVYLGNPTAAQFAISSEYSPLKKLHDDDGSVPLYSLSRRNDTLASNIPFADLLRTSEPNISMHAFDVHVRPPLSSNDHTGHFVSLQMNPPQSHGIPANIYDGLDLQRNLSLCSIPLHNRGIQQEPSQNLAALHSEDNSSSNVVCQLKMTSLHADRNAFVPLSSALQVDGRATHMNNAASSPSTTLEQPNAVPLSMDNPTSASRYGAVNLLKQNHQALDAATNTTGSLPLFGATQVRNLVSTPTTSLQHLAATPLTISSAHVNSTIPLSMDNPALTTQQGAAAYVLQRDDDFHATISPGFQSLSSQVATHTTQLNDITLTPTTSWGQHASVVPLSMDNPTSAAQQLDDRFRAAADSQGTHAMNFVPLSNLTVPRTTQHNNNITTIQQPLSMENHGLAAQQSANGILQVDDHFRAATVSQTMQLYEIDSAPITSLQQPDAIPLSTTRLVDLSNKTARAKSTIPLSMESSGANAFQSGDCLLTLTTPQTTAANAVKFVPLSNLAGSHATQASNITAASTSFLQQHAAVPSSTAQQGVLQLDDRFRTTTVDTMNFVPLSELAPPYSKQLGNTAAMSTSSWDQPTAALQSTGLVPLTMNSTSATLLNSTIPLSMGNPASAVQHSATGTLQLDDHFHAAAPQTTMQLGFFPLSHQATMQLNNLTPTPTTGQPTGVVRLAMEANNTVSVPLSMETSAHQHTVGLDDTLLLHSYNRENGDPRFANNKLPSASSLQNASQLFMDDNDRFAPFIGTLQQDGKLQSSQPLQPLSTDHPLMSGNATPPINLNIANGNPAATSRLFHDDCFLQSQLQTNDNTLKSHPFTELNSNPGFAPLSNPQAALHTNKYSTQLNYLDLAPSHPSKFAVLNDAANQRNVAASQLFMDPSNRNNAHLLRQDSFSAVSPPSKSSLDFYTMHINEQQQQPLFTSLSTAKSNLQPLYSAQANALSSPQQDLLHGGGFAALRLGTNPQANLQEQQQQSHLFQLRKSNTDNKPMLLYRATVPQNAPADSNGLFTKLSASPSNNDFMHRATLNQVPFNNPIQDFDVEHYPVSNQLWGGDPRIPFSAQAQNISTKHQRFGELMLDNHTANGYMPLEAQRNQAALNLLTGQLSTDPTTGGGAPIHSSFAPLKLASSNINRGLTPLQGYDASNQLAYLNSGDDGNALRGQENTSYIPLQSTPLVMQSADAALNNNPRQSRSADLERAKRLAAMSLDELELFGSTAPTLELSPQKHIMSALRPGDYDVENLGDSQQYVSRLHLLHARLGDDFDEQHLSPLLYAELKKSGIPQKMSFNMVQSKLPTGKKTAKPKVSFSQLKLNDSMFQVLTIDKDNDDEDVEIYQDIAKGILWTDDELTHMFSGSDNKPFDKKELRNRIYEWGDTKFVELELEDDDNEERDVAIMNWSHVWMDEVSSPTKQRRDDDNNKVVLYAKTTFEDVRMGGRLNKPLQQSVFETTHLGGEIMTDQLLLGGGDSSSKISGLLEW